MEKKGLVTATTTIVVVECLQISSFWFATYT